MGALPNERAYTMEDIYNLPEGQRAELIDGQLYLMGASKTIHARLSKALYRSLDRHIEEHSLPCEPFYSPFGVWLFSDDTIYLEPDISVVCDQSKIDDDGCKGAPDFVIEILSKSTLWLDKVRKLNLYLQAGVREYWIVDPWKRKITQWLFQPELDDEVYSFDDDVPVSICPGFSINLSAYGF